jgi:hypothetical protein
VAELSPAALAVREAAEKETDLDFRYAPNIAAAALQAAVEQVGPPLRDPHAYLSEREEEVLTAIGEILCELLAIAAELRDNNTL